MQGRWKGKCGRGGQVPIRQEWVRCDAREVLQGAIKNVCLIDESHMISAGSFNALLKTLEEPPHVTLLHGTRTGCSLT